MEKPQRRTNDEPKVSFMGKASRVAFSRNGSSHYSYGLCGQNGNGSNKWVILCLGLLNIVLLIVAAVLGTNCAKVKEGSYQASHSAATQLINELNSLRNNHSDVIEAEEEAKRALKGALKDHEKLKVQIQQLITINDGYQKQMEILQAEKTTLKSNITELEGTCGRCLSGWMLLNSSCYFFSYAESSTVIKNWADSRADCVRRGADLVVIDNPEEQEFVSNKIQVMKGSRGNWESGFWIGITDIETEGTWVWINNVTEVEQRYWVDGEPNNHGKQGEDCGIAVYRATNPWKTWFDGKCNEFKFPWICEMPAK